MSVVIRPSPAVFLGTPQILIVFGAFLKYDTAHTVSAFEGERLAQLVAEARRYRVSLGFARRMNPDGSPRSGTWIPGCRPSVRDMLFDHVGDSALSNPELELVLCDRIGQGLFFAGPASDSSIQFTLEACISSGLPVKRVDHQDMLQKCSTAPRLKSSSNLFPYWARDGLLTTYSSWVRTLRNVEDAE
jgi:hypothetical protein